MQISYEIISWWAIEMHFMDVLYYNESDKIDWAHFPKFYPLKKHPSYSKMQNMYLYLTEQSVYSLYECEQV